MPKDMEWSEEVDERLDTLDERIRSLSTANKLLSGGTVFLGLGVAVLGVATIKVVKGFNQIVPVVNQLTELANNSQAAIQAQMARAMPPVSDRMVERPIPFDDNTPEAPAQKPYDTGQREIPDSLRDELEAFEGELGSLFDQDNAQDYSEELPDNSNLPDPS